mgnify:CR=1 FL=1
MAFRDRFFTPATAKAILSWRLLLGAVVGVAAGFLIHPVVGIVAGVGLYAASVLAAMPSGPPTVRIDPFTLSEPWRQFVQQGQRADRRLRDTVRAASDGPLKDRLKAIADELERGLGEAFKVARRGDEIDAAVTRLDPVALRSRLGTLEQQAGDTPSEAHTAAIDSVRTQLASADRLKAQSHETAEQLRLTSTRLDELVARAAEVAVGSAEPDTYARDVDNLVEQLAALNLAVQETDEPPTIEFPGT